LFLERVNKTSFAADKPEASQRSRNVDLGETGCTAAVDRGTPEKAEGKRNSTQAGE
jgi:hypothetical protein